MEQKISTLPFGTTQDGREVSLFRIPNNTNDYVEVSTYGCSMRSIRIHNRQGKLQSVLQGFETLAEYEASGETPGAVAAGPDGAGLPGLLAHRVWDVSEVGSNYVLLTCETGAAETGCPMRAGVRIMWVNLNRLVLDLYITPREKASVNFACNFPFRLSESGALDGCRLRSFCPQVLTAEGVRPVDATPFAAQAFEPVTAETVLLAEGDDVRPMAELADTAAGLTISVYGNLSCLRAVPRQGAICLNQTLLHGVELEAGQTLTGRLIYGFDRLFTKEEMENPQPSPFSAFF